MSQISYIKAIGDADYNFAYNDFTVEFFVKPTTNLGSSIQTLFEITNNDFAIANAYSSTRFLTVIDQLQVNSYAIQISANLPIGGGSNVFISPFPITSNNKIFYNGSLLQNSQYSVSGRTNVTLQNISIDPNPTTVEIGTVLFEVLGSNVSINTLHFISAERSKNQFYLFLDGIAQSAPVAAFNAIPTQVLNNNTSNANLQRFGSPALLTIGANRDGIDPFYGQFGDIKVVNGAALHVQEAFPQNIISSEFTDANLGEHYADIIIDGGNFVDDISNPVPEEFVPCQIFDSLYIQVYQSSTSNPNANILSFSLFKPTIMAGPIGEFYFVAPPSGESVSVPWSSLDQAAASVLVNGSPISANAWSVIDGMISVPFAAPGANIEVIATGPTTYYDVNANTVSVIIGNLYANSTTINVANTAPFVTPNIGNISAPYLNVRGQVFINQEYITYLYIDRVANTLSGLQRGTSGTGVPNVHLSNSRIISASYTNDIEYLTGIDPREQIWYSVPVNGTSLQNTHTTISTLLVNNGGLPPITPF